MKIDDILLLGLAKSVTAFLRTDGTVLWKTELPDAASSSFITLTTDARRIYATCHGALTCLDLFSGQILWSDPLRGYGYEIGSLCLPGQHPPEQAAAAAEFEAQERSQSSLNATAATA